MKHPNKRQSLLSTMWIFLLLNMIFRDLHQIGKAAFIEEILSGVVGGVEITDKLMLFGGVLAEIPILMVLLSKYLPAKLNRWANTLAGVITALVLLSSLPTADLDDIFFLTIEIPALLFIVLVAWELPIGQRANSILGKL